MGEWKTSVINTSDRRGVHWILGMWGLSGTNGSPRLVLWEWYKTKAFSEHIQDKFRQEFPSAEEPKLFLTDIQKCSWRCGYYAVWVLQKIARMLALGSVPDCMDEVDPPPTPEWEHLVWKILEVRDRQPSSHGVRQVQLTRVLDEALDTGTFDFSQAHDILETYMARIQVHVILAVVTRFVLQLAMGPLTLATEAHPIWKKLFFFLSKH